MQRGLFQEKAVRFAQVALDTPVRREFSYAVPAGVEPLSEGARVRVPFGPRRAVGVVVGLDDRLPPEVPAGRVRAIEARLDPEPLLTPALLRLARVIADRTYCSWGQALTAMLPAALRRERARRTVPVAELVREPDAEQIEELERRYPKQARAVAVLLQAGGPMEVRDFCNRTGLSRSPLESLERKGWVRFGRKRDFLDPFRDARAEPDVPPEPTPAQRDAIDAVVAALDTGEHGDFLLYGITGSGKTEVYLRALRRCLEQDRGAIVLVPEIALTPQTIARFRARCGDVAVLHSGLTDAERHDQWVAIREGRLRVVVGARSALFAPMPRLGLIIVDEEHESSFKQESTPRYHARDVARERARLEHAVCVMGTATPSLEAWTDAHFGGGLRLLELPERVAGGRLPEVNVVDMREQKPEHGHWNVVSAPLEAALAGAFADDARAILFLNQRGFAPAWHCRGCGGSVHCPQCDVALTYHRWRRKAQCHWCLEEHPEPQDCPHCQGPVSLVGVGTERAESTLQRLFPEARVARMDRDTMLRRESYEEILGAFGRGEYDVLLGTQMVAKGLDFPDVTVVGVLNADTALHHPDFRSSERCFDLIAQVAGRAGRSHRAGRVIVQTWLPEHPAIRAAARHDYRAFAAYEMEERRDLGYPPFGHVVRITCEAADARRVERMAEAAAERLRGPAQEGRALLLGPSVPPVERLRGRVRRQILIKGDGAAMRALQPALYEVCQKQGVLVEAL